MNLFNSILVSASKGRLVTSFCRNCDKYIWPPNYVCNLCYSKASFQEVKGEGILLEKAHSSILGKEGSFGVGEFSGIRLIGTLNDGVKVGDSIKIQEIRVKNERLDIKFAVISRLNN
ncbi:MAG TPA: zinc ribbon domain-containing protein [Candidatus Nitrosocosmicus sp.]|nr:zinc ribbon domain-containing protein [Candidatus Nitrosocosmicus sp.]